MIQNFILSVVLFSSFGLSDKNVCKYLFKSNAQVERQLHNQGFHRTLETNVIISAMEQIDACYVMVKENLPAGAYFDPSQLKFMSELEDVQFYIPTKVNVETPTHYSQGLTAYFFALPIYIEENTWIVNISIPVHLRYHRSKNGIMGQTEKVQISHPSIHLLCDLEEIPECSMYSQLEPCPPFGDLMCDWLPINSFSTSEDVVAEVPVGNIEMLDSVLFTTASVTIAAMLLILAAISNKKVAL